MAKEEVPDLAPVEAPAELFALARFKTPRTAIESVAAWANFPLKLRDALPAELAGLEGVIAWDAPLEAAVALDPLGEGKVPEPLAAFSLGLTSLEAALDFARAKGQSVRRLRAGVYRVGDAEDVSCAIGSALGAAPARLVCGHRARDVDGLFNYAARGLPSEPLPNLDFQIELRLAPLKKKYEAELGSARLLAGFLLRTLKIDKPRFDRALSDATYALVDEATAFIHDLDRVRIDSSLDNEKLLVDSRLTLKFSGQKSWFVQASAEMLPLIEPAPALFWQMPYDSAAASFAVGWKPGRLQPIGRTLADLMDGFLESEKVSAGFREQAARGIEAAFDQNTKQVRAQGQLSEFPPDPLLAAAYRMFGWEIAALDGDPKRLSALLDGLVGLLGSREIVRVVKERAELDVAPLMPKMSVHTLKLRGFKPGAKGYRVDIPRELLEKYAKNQGSLLPASTATGKALGKRVPLTLIVAFDGEHTWVGVSPDEKAMIRRLESLKDLKTPTLASRDGLAALRGVPHAVGGFVTIAQFGSRLASLAVRDAGPSGALLLPHHGETPVVFSCDLSAAGPELTAGFSVPRAAVEDLGALAVALLAGRRSQPPAP
jgi:hypothetical protein